MKHADHVVIVDRFRKSPTETVFATLQMLNGRKLADIRVWLPLASGQLVPGRKGLAIDVALLPLLGKAVRALETAAADLAAGEADDADVHCVLSNRDALTGEPPADATGYEITVLQRPTDATPAPDAMGPTNGR